MNKLLGIGVSLVLALAAWAFATYVPVAGPIVGGPVVAIILGMIIAVFWKDKGKFDAGIKFTSKKILQWAVILLGFGLDLGVILQTGKESLPIIVCTITTSLLIAFIFCKLMKIPSKISILVGVGSSICGGSAIAATAPVIDAKDEEVAQSISVIFFFNVIAALIFPTFGKLLGFDTTRGTSFGIFAGTAINDTSSVTAAASTWDEMFGLGTATLDKAVTVKLTRTLAIIPITLILAFIRTRKEKKSGGERSKIDFKKIFPFFILYFVLASVITTVLNATVPAGIALETVHKVFKILKNLSKFFIIMSMGAIGLNTDIIKLIKTGGKPLALGFLCWTGITAVSLMLQHVIHLW